MIRVTKHNGKILRYNSDDKIVGYPYFKDTGQVTILVNINAGVLSGTHDDQPQLYTWTPSGETEQSKYFTSYYIDYNDVNSGTTLYDSEGNITDITLHTLVKFSDNYERDGITEEHAIYPHDTIYRMFAHITSDPDPIMEIGGLQTGREYTVKLYGTRDQYDATTRYTITGGTSKDGEYGDLIIKDNFTNTVDFVDVEPSQSGKIQVKFSIESGGAYINVIEIIV
jgi:hypothetical protein